MSQYYPQSGMRNQFTPYVFNQRKKPSTVRQYGGTPQRTELNPMMTQLMGMGMSLEQVNHLMGVMPMHVPQANPQSHPLAARKNQAARPLAGGPKKDGVTLGLIEVGATSEDGGPDEHAQGVYNLAQAYTGGDNPVKLIQFGESNAQPMGAVPPPEQVASLRELDQAIDYLGSDALNAAAVQLNDIAAEKTDGNREVLNLSLGYSRALVYHDVLVELEHNPSLQATITGGLNSSNGAAYVQRVVDYVNRRLDNSTSQKSAQASYDNAVDAAKAKGIVVVVAAGNEQELLDELLGPGGYQAPGAALNFLAQADDVISVAAHDADGRIAEFSSRGGGQFAPDIAAFGVGVDTGLGVLEDGTSFAAPAVSSTIVEMLELNPNLTVEQIELYLKESAIDTQASVAAEGAGLLNAQQAIQWAGYQGGDQQSYGLSAGDTAQTVGEGAQSVASLSASQMRDMKGVKAMPGSGAMVLDASQDTATPLNARAQMALTAYARAKIGGGF